MTGITGTLPPADVCIVGAGPAGLTLAQALGRTGHVIALVESGGFQRSTRAQELNDGDVKGEPYTGLQATRNRGVGGTARIWNVEIGEHTGAKYVPLDPHDLAAWPIGWHDLAPFYREAQTICGLGPFEYGAEPWTTDERTPFDFSGTGLISAVYQFGQAERFSHRLVDEIHTLPNVHLVPSATVIGLAIDASGSRVRGLQVVHESGNRLEVAAKAFVLACGAVENARLLLLAAPEAGIPSKWLGRCFMEHARDFSLTLVPGSRELITRAAFYDLHPIPPGGEIFVGGRIALREDAIEEFDLPNASLTLFPKHGVRRRRSAIRQAWRRWTGVQDDTKVTRYGWSHPSASTDRLDEFKVVLNLEQRPDPANRIELGPRADRFGNPLPTLHLEWTAAEQERLDRLRSLLGEWCRTAGLGALRYHLGRRPDLNAHHHAGTTRMASDPEGGVTDPQGRVFGLENLFVSGASLFPTAGFANPMLTIVALALRLARHLDSTPDLKA